MPPWIEHFIVEARKFLVALAGLIAYVLTTGLAHGDVEHWLTVAFGALTAIGVYAVPNGKPQTAPLGAPVEDEVYHPADPATDHVNIDPTTGTVGA